MDLPRRLHGFVCLTWVFFRAADFSTAALILRKIAGFEPGGAHWTYLPLLLILPIVIVAHVTGTWTARREAEFHGGTQGIIPPPVFAEWLYGRQGTGIAVRPHHAAGLYLLLPRAGFASASIVTIWLTTLFLLSPVNVRPFIYFQF